MSREVRGNSQPEQEKDPDDKKHPQSGTDHHDRELRDSHDRSPSPRVVNEEEPQGSADDGQRRYAERKVDRTVPRFPLTGRGTYAQP